jgi:hypothetical protein
LVSENSSLAAFTCKTFSTPFTFCASISLLPLSTLSTVNGNTRVVVLLKATEISVSRIPWPNIFAAERKMADAIIDDFKIFMYWILGFGIIVLQQNFMPCLNG